MGTSRFRMLCQSPDTCILSLSNTLFFNSTTRCDRQKKTRDNYSTPQNTRNTKKKKKKKKKKNVINIKKIATSSNHNPMSKKK